MVSASESSQGKCVEERAGAPAAVTPAARSGAMNAPAASQRRILAPYYAQCLPLTYRLDQHHTFFLISSSNLNKLVVSRCPSVLLTKGDGDSRLLLVMRFP